MNFLACCGVKKHCPKPQQKKQEYSPAFSVPFLLWAINMDIYLVDNIFCEEFAGIMREYHLLSRRIDIRLGKNKKERSAQHSKSPPPIKGDGLLLCLFFKS